MVLGDEHAVEIRLCAHNRVQVVKLRERVLVLLIKVVVNCGADDAQRVAVAPVQVHADLRVDVLGDVVRGVAGDDPVFGRRLGGGGLDVAGREAAARRGDARGGGRSDAGRPHGLAAEHVCARHAEALCQPCSESIESLGAAGGR